MQQQDWITLTGNRVVHTDAVDFYVVSKGSHGDYGRKKESSIDSLRIGT